MNAITPASASMAALVESANEYLVAAYGTGTQEKYRSGQRHYDQWCDEHGVAPLSGDPKQVALYAVACAKMGHAFSTINVRMAAIAEAHRLAGIHLNRDDAILSKTLKGIASTHGRAPKRQVEPATASKLRLMLTHCKPHTTPMGARDRAMLLIGFGAALRRSELSDLLIRDAKPLERNGSLEALEITIRRSKTDQTGQGRRVTILANPDDPEFCAATAFIRWMEHRRRGEDGGKLDRPLFCAIDKAGRLSCKPIDVMALVYLIKRTAKAAGFNPDDFAGHSLRAGMATTADEGGAPLTAIQNHLRHADPRTTARYIRFGDLANNPSAKAFGRGVAA